MNGAGGKPALRGEFSGKMKPRHLFAIALPFLIAAAAARADTISCEMEDGVALTFIIDRSQFVTEISPEEPIRRKTTNVRYGDRRFPAEPFLIGEMRGFHAQNVGGTDMMFVVRPDGAATFTDPRAGLRATGTCEIAP